VAGPLYALGAFGASLLVQTLTLWLFPFHTGPGGAPPEQVGLALALGRVVNSASDVVVARWSDALVTPWGRRRPFLVLGSPLLALSFVAVWLQPGDTAFLAAALCAFFALFAAVVNPYLALLADLHFAPAGRVAIAGWQAAGNLLGTAAAFVGSGPLANRHGYPGMAAALGTVAVACLWASAAAVRTEPKTPHRLSLGQALRGLVRNPVLVAYLSGLTLSWVGLSMVSLILVFLVTVLMGLPREATPAVLGAALASTAVFLPVVARWGQRSGAQPALEACLWVAALFLPAVSVVGWLPGDPRHHGYLLVAVSGLPLAALYALPNAVLAQVAARGGHGALHFGVQGLALNLANAAAAACVGMLLRLGHTPGDDAGLRAVPTAACGFVLLGLWAFRRMRYSWPTSPGSAVGSRR
jgi:GPH family glycoside/pentoside/hexuronide:cation symporter